MRHEPSSARATGLAALLLLAATTLPAQAQGEPETRDFADILAAAEGQTVYWNAWGGDPATNDFIAWVGEEVRERHGVSVVHVKLSDTAEAVSRVLAEKAAGRDEGGAVDLIWINGPNFLAMKEESLLHGPFVEALPNFALVDTQEKPSNVVDFTVPVEGLAAPWRIAQVAYLYDVEAVDAAALPGSIPEMRTWAEANPGRLTHPTARDFMGTTFLKQALVELVDDRAALQEPATDETYAQTVAPLWDWYDALRPNLWRAGAEFPESGPAQNQLLADGEIDMAITFNPAEAAAGAIQGRLPETIRVFFLEDGTIGNTSFVAIPYNAAHKEGAMVVANFLMSPEAQARGQDPANLGAFTVLDLSRLSPDERAAFDQSDAHPAMPAPEEFVRVLPEPHPSWMTRLVADWERRISG
ncbi:ABC transporter substrate-binding protein [Salinarimonas rosea]|uniref:ABC transporter substrate-binding protein n=1 Tax=Salinarimonas rosea TaxID=552063 RepID=UPI0003FED595|nr:ABC transporter substrate-binding protein [Salinarimonas rosea]